MKIVALMTVRNEEKYLERSLSHLHAQGVEVCLIDNSSTDSTLAIAQKFTGNGVMRIEHLPFTGKYDWEAILKHKEQLSREIDADWFIHHDADEIREAPKPYKTLKEGIQAADAQGFNAINFDEFVFLPTSDDGAFEGTDYVQSMTHYYFFEPYPLRQIKAWKKNPEINLHATGGHSAAFPERKLFPTSFIMRHYIVLSKRHAIQKYVGCIYPKSELDQGRSLHRAMVTPDRLCFPRREQLKKIDANGDWDTSDPWKTHYFLGQHQPLNSQVRIYQTLASPMVPSPTQSQKDDHIPELSVSNNAYLPMPIIVGAPRSGTTLLRLMLDAHPEIAILPETHFIPSLLDLEPSSQASSPHLSQPQSLRDQFYNRLIHDERWHDFHLDPHAFYQQLQTIEPFSCAEGLRCFFRLYAARFDKHRWGDKTPPYVFQLTTVAALLPEAHFIHIIRDGRDAALSLKNLWWGPGDDMEAQASGWLWRIREGRQQAQFCPHYLEVRYENLVTDTTRILQEICEFIQLPYNSAMEEYHRTAQQRLDELMDQRHPDGSIIYSKDQRTRIFHLATQAPDPSRIGRWRWNMSVADQDKFEAIAGPMLCDLGYQTRQSTPKLSLSNSTLLDTGPNVIGCMGGSGSRVVARIVQQGGLDIGNNRNASEDAMDFHRCLHLFQDFLCPYPFKSMDNLSHKIQVALECHVSNLSTISNSENKWGWKQPRSIYLIPLLNQHFSNFKFLHLIRDGRDMAFSGNQQQLRDYGHMLLSSTEQTLSQPLQSLILWSRINSMAAQYGEANMPGRYLRIRFEDLCDNPYDIITQIFEFFDLKGDVDKIAQEEVSPPDSIGRWKRQNPNIIKQLHEIGQTALTKFGYLNFAPTSLSDTTLDSSVISSSSHVKTSRDMRNSPILASHTLVSKADSEKPNIELISEHTAKTGGSAFRTILTTVYGVSAIQHDYRKCRVESIKDIRLNAKVLHGHFPLSKWDRQFPEAKKITWLRHPILRGISLYFFQKNDPDRVREGKPELYELLFKEKITVLDFFNQVEERMVEQAPERTIQDYDFIGIQEFFSSDVFDLQALMNWPDVEIKQENENRYPKYLNHLLDILNDDALMQELATSRAEAIAIYQEALNIRAKRRGELPISAQQILERERSHLLLKKTQLDLEQSSSRLQQMRELVF